MKNKILFYPLLFFVASLILSQITDLFEKERLKELRYQEGIIKDFTLIGINNDRYILKGKKMLEKEKELIIDNFNLTYKTPQEDIHVLAEKGIYYKNKDTLNLIDNVKISTHNLKLQTSFLTILVNERRAFNSDFTTITSKDMLTQGKNVFINLKEETIKLEEVKTVFRGG